LGIPVIYQAERVVNFNMIAHEFPRTPFIVAHLGSYNFVWGEHVAAIDAARRFPNVYLDTSLIGLFQFLEMAATGGGASKLIFGSGGQEFDARVELHKIKLLKLSAADEAKVLGGNIQRLLPKGSI
jgi:predicted TIM-barrel fold metal-dependent hydrolase